ncbi:MAG: putative signal transduction histidine kinase [Bacteroidetes bacterium]|nr:putative signal transduction histidine kinase [Bacteroidota bacterium]
MKKESRVLFITMACLYIFFTVLKLYTFPNLSMAWQIEGSIFGFIVLIVIMLSMRVVDMVLDRLYPYERSLVLRLVIQFAISLVIVLTLREFIFHFTKSYLPVKVTRELYIVATAAHILFIATVVLTMFGFRFFNKWKETELKKEVLEKEKATVQYDNLKNQLNPHFLFNSLTSLNSLIFENPQLASEFLHQLSKVYRYVLENKDKTVVSLSTEVNFISHYVQLLSSRFDGGLNVNIKLSEAALDQHILPVTLQILIENAIKHNITSTDSPLTIDIYDESGYLVVQNNLQVKQIIDTSNKQGLENLKNLYKVLIEKEVMIEQTQDRFSVKIPLI